MNWFLWSFRSTALWKSGSSCLYSTFLTFDCWLLGRIVWVWLKEISNQHHLKIRFARYEWTNISCHWLKQHELGVKIKRSWVSKPSQHSLMKLSRKGSLNQNLKFQNSWMFSIIMIWLFHFFTKTHKEVYSVILIRLFAS